MTLGLSYPPVASPGQRDYTAGHMADLGVSVLRFAVSWAAFEAREGQIDVDALAARADWLREHGYRAVVTIPAKSPEWAGPQPGCFDSAAFRSYVAKVVSVFGSADILLAIQAGNEPEADEFWPHSVAEYIAFVRVISDVARSSNLPVCLGGVTSGTSIAAGLAAGVIREGFVYDRFYTSFSDLPQWVKDKAARADEIIRGCIDLVDALDAHVYDNCGALGAVAEVIERRYDKSVVITEWGYPTVRRVEAEGGYSRRRHAREIKQGIHAAQSVHAALYYRLSGGAQSAFRYCVLTDERGEPKRRVYDAFGGAG